MCSEIRQPSFLSFKTKVKYVQRIENPEVFVYETDRFLVKRFRLKKIQLKPN